MTQLPILTTQSNIGTRSMRCDTIDQEFNINPLTTIACCILKEGGVYTEDKIKEVYNFVKESIGISNELDIDYIQARDELMAKEIQKIQVVISANSIFFQLTGM